jgi:hypothetical protein
MDALALSEHGPSLFRIQVWTHFLHVFDRSDDGDLTTPLQQLMDVDFRVVGFS